MASGNGNGDSLNPIASPSAVAKVSNVLVPQMPMQLAPPLFDDWHIFISVPQYHCHVTEGDTEARQHIIAFAQQLHEFGQRTKAREAEMWRRLGLVAMTDVMQATELNTMQRQSRDWIKCGISWLYCKEEIWTRWLQILPY